MAENWSVVRRQDEACRWLQMSEYGFWLCHRDGLEARTPFRPEGFLKEWERFRRIGQELWVLEWDLTECLNEFKNAYQALYREGRDLAPKKLNDKGFRSLWEFDRELDAHKVIQRARQHPSS